MFAAASAALSRSLGGDDVYDGDSERGVKRLSSSLSRKFSLIAARFLAIRGERFGSTGVDGGGDGTDGGEGARCWRERTLEVGEDMRGGKLELIGGNRIMTK